MNTPEQLVPQLRLSDGNLIPQVGYGVYKISDDDAQELVGTALQAGYRHIDTATLYENERAVGRAVRESGLDRADVFVTTKVWNDDQGYDQTLRAFEASTKRLDLGYVDLYLIHWPVPSKDLYVETWRALIHLQEQGAVRSIGVSNFNHTHLDRLIKDTGHTPVINQVELHPYLSQNQVRAANAQRGILTQAWSPLGRGNGVLAEPAVLAIAQQLGRSPAQVVLRWHLERGTVIIPKSAHPQRIADNIALFDFDLTDAQRATLEALNSNSRTGADPDLG